MKKKAHISIIFILVLGLVLPTILGGKIYEIWAASAECQIEHVDDLVCDTTTGWSLMWGGKHMGTKNTTYSFLSQDLKQQYGEFMTYGKTNWGTTISCQEVSAGGLGSVWASATPADFVGATGTEHASGLPGSQYNVNVLIHTTTWSFVFYPLFESLSASNKVRIITHELGHVYGLGHVSSTSSIMFETLAIEWTASIPTTQEKRGMEVMTHVHTHGSDFTYGERCTYCKAKKGG